MTSGYRQDHSIMREFPMCQVLVPGCEASHKPGIQSAGQDSVNLMNRKQMMELQFRVWLSMPKLAKGVYNQSMPGYRSGNSDTERTGFAKGNALGAKFRVIDVLQDTSRIAQEQFPRCTQSDASR